jgi:hypothetical protein
MDQHYFEAWTRTLTSVPSRRDLLRGLAGAGLGLAALRLPDAAEAKKRHKKKKHKKIKKSQPQPVINQFGCLDVGQPCRGGSANCCSGICQGIAPKKRKSDTSTCVEHNAGICTPQYDSCAAGVSVSCHASNESCYCTMTTGNAPFCGDFTTTSGVEELCRVCSEDTDCQAELGPGAACVLLADACTAICAATGRTACVPPCA